MSPSDASDPASVGPPSAMITFPASAVIMAGRSTITLPTRSSGMPAGAGSASSGSTSVARPEAKSRMSIAVSGRLVTT